MRFITLTMRANEATRLVEVLDKVLDGNGTNHDAIELVPILKHVLWALGHPGNDDVDVREVNTDGHPLCYTEPRVGDYTTRTPRKDG